MTVDHPDAAPVDRLCRWAEDRFGGPVEPVEAPVPNGAGFDAAIWFVELAGDGLPAEWRRPLVLRIKPDADRLAVVHREAAVHDWLVRQAFPAPEILTVLDPGIVDVGPAQVMARAAGTMMLDAVLGAPWRAPTMIRALADTHVRIHQLDPTGFPSTDDLLDARLRLTRQTADALADADLQRGLDAVLALAGRLRDAPPTVCHGDYHPLNVVVGDDGSATVLDWTDAGVGDRHGDVARTLVLFGVAAIAASNTVERVVLRGVGPLLGRQYRRRYARTLSLDPARVALWTPVHLLHGWSDALGVAHGVFGAGSGGAFAALAVELRRRFDRAIADIS